MFYKNVFYTHSFGFFYTNLHFSRMSKWNPLKYGTALVCHLCNTNICVPLILFPFFVRWLDLHSRKRNLCLNATLMTSKTTYYNFNFFVLFFFLFLILPPISFFTGSPLIAAVTAAATTPHFYNRRAEIVREKNMDEKEKKNSSYISICMLYKCTHKKKESSWRWRTTLTRGFFFLLFLEK